MITAFLKHGRKHEVEEERIRKRPLRKIRNEDDLFKMLKSTTLTVLLSVVTISVDLPYDLLT